MEKKGYNPTFKVIELEDHFIDHSSDYPYVQSCHKNKQVIFTLRSTKTFKYQPILIIDSCQKDSLELPLSIGKQIHEVKNCQIMMGQFIEDGCWRCKYEFKQPGMLQYQLVFVEYGDEKIKDIGSFDCILKVQNKTQLRKLRKLTIFPRCIGKINDWNQFLQKQVELGYNAFHFAPIQQTGFSKSYYSIFDQLCLASDLFNGDSKNRYKELEEVLSKYQKQGIIFFVDIVLSHTSFDSDWIKECQNAVYTVENTPLLKSAYELDEALRSWGEQTKQIFGKSGKEMTYDQFEIIKQQVHKLVIGLKISEFFEMKQNITQQFIKNVIPRIPSQNIFAKDPSQLILQFIEKQCIGLGQNRKSVTIDNLGQKWKKLNYVYEQNDALNGIKKFNKKWQKIIKNQWQKQIINNILKQIKQNYLEKKCRNYCDKLPFINPYFSFVSLKKGKVISALNNGWVLNANTKENLVLTKQFYYLRRKVSIWGDLVRIRYCQSRQDSPAWQHMQKYVRTMAQYFDGFRLDNLHGTHLKVAQYMMKQARKIKRQIIVFAELFTSTQKQRAQFVRTSGVNSILFQLKNYLSGTQFLKLFYQSMGNQGKFTGSLSRHFQRPNGHRVKYCKRKKPIPLIYDQTHDNNAYESQGKIIMKTPIAIITQFSGTFIGSTKGFDQFYCNKISVTQTQQLYKKDTDKKIQNINISTWNKKFIFTSNCNQDYVELYGSWNQWAQGKKMDFYGKVGFEVCVALGNGKYQYKYKVNGQWVTDSKREVNSNGNHTFTIDYPLQKHIYHNLEMLRKKGSQQRQKYFSYNQYFAYNQQNIIVLMRQKKHTRQAMCVLSNLSNETQLLQNSIKLPGIIQKVDVWVQSVQSRKQGFTIDVDIIHSPCIDQYFDYFFSEQEQKDILVTNSLPPGFGCVISCKKTQKVSQALKTIIQLKQRPIKLPTLGPLDYNLILYGVDSQQQARFNSNTFYLPSENRKLIFCGFGGIIAELQRAKITNNLSGGLFDSIREGNWLLDYYLNRLKRFEHLSQFTAQVSTFFQCLKQIPSYLRPKYFTDFIYKIYQRLQEEISHASRNRFYRKLLLATTQFISSFQNSNPLLKITLAGGLPYDCIGGSRCWGRDTFMSNQLLLQHCEVYHDIILQYASALRHGMIPNLFDYGNNPRYNSRDVCWWFIRGVKQYVQYTKDYDIFKTKVNMLFLSNDLLQHKQKVRNGQKKVMVLQDIIHNIFQSHASGITYRQWNSGFQIDPDMSTHGFSIYINVEDTSGFLVGGNAYNCLTWMDKMGSSARAGNKGYPATSRSGAPIQLTALLYHCLVQYDKLNEEGYYSYNSVELRKTKTTFYNWSKKISDSFEDSYWIDPKNDRGKYQNIYKDVAYSPPNLQYEEYRLRPNALVALALTPQLLIPDHALKYLQVVQRQLLCQHSLGVASLGHAHQSLYSSTYDNQDDSNDIKTAKGFSYHNGPEWVWLYGFYIKAKCNFNKKLQKYQLYALLQNHTHYIYSQNWGSLPELTNRNGEKNKYSGESQAQSISSMLLAVNSINEYQS